MSSTFVQKVRAASWYPDVEASMQAAGVPDYLWISVVRDEDQTLFPYQVTPDSGGTFSYGLFEFNQDPATGLSPHASGVKAAQWLRNALAPLGPSYTPRQALTASEAAGWPGNNAALIAKEDPTRAQLMEATLAEMGLPASGVVSGVGASSSSQAPFDPLGIGAASTSLQSWGTNLSNQIFIGAVILAAIAGGFALIASSNGPRSNDGGNTFIFSPAAAAEAAV